jgi:(p)ppGpp synthase/HD superfamily hydrolase
MLTTVVQTEVCQGAKQLNQTNTDALDLEMAISFAVHAHAGQRLAYGGPYILHPLRLMNAMLDQTQDSYLAALAVLHDTVERTATTLDEIEELFGKHMRADMDALTHRPDEDYFDFIRRISLNPRATRVSLAAIADHKILSFVHPLPFEVQYEHGSRHNIARGILTEAALQAAKAH